MPKVSEVKVTKPTSQFPYIATVIAFVAIVIMFGLGFWQLDRKAEKEIRLESIETAKLSSNISLEKALSNIDEYQDYIVSVKGKIINKAFYIDNKLLESRAGFHVLIPYKTSAGIVMLNLGWLPATGLRTDFPIFKLPLLESVEGIAHLPLNNNLITETNGQYGEFPALLQQVDLHEIETHLGIEVLPLVLRLSMESNDFKREWKAVVMSPEKHLAYAVQWFGLAIAALTIYLLSMVKWFHGPLPTNPNKQNNKK